MRCDILILRKNAAIQTLLFFPPVEYERAACGTRAVLFVFPNAMVNIIPVYRGEVINMLKSTSVVGYIAIQDITKMSDIIRSRTFEAFFPLLVTALIYFVLAWIIAAALKEFLKRLDPKTKKRRIKGVKTK